MFSVFIICKKYKQKTNTLRHARTSSVLAGDYVQRQDRGRLDCGRRRPSAWCALPCFMCIESGAQTSFLFFLWWRSHRVEAPRGCLLERRPAAEPRHSCTRCTVVTLRTPHFLPCFAFYDWCVPCDSTHSSSPRCSELEGGPRLKTAFEDGGAARLHRYIPHLTHAQHTMRASLTCTLMSNHFGHCHAPILLFRLHARVLFAEPACAHLKNPAQILAPCTPRCIPLKCIC